MVMEYKSSVGSMVSDRESRQLHAFLQSNNCYVWLNWHYSAGRGDLPVNITTGLTPIGSNSCISHYIMLCACLGDT